MATVVKNKKTSDKNVISIKKNVEEIPQKPVLTEIPVQKPELTKPVSQGSMAFGRENYVWMLAGIALVIAGFTIMSLDTAEFGFGFMGLTLGPIVVMLGFITEFFAILRKPKHA